MTRRFFLIALVLFLLLVNAAFTQVINATVFTQGEMLGLIPYWELKESLPCGLFAAAAFTIATGLGAQFWRGLLPVCGAGPWVPVPRLSQLATAGLWCGWPLLASCMVAASYLFPWAVSGEGIAGTLFTRQNLFILLYGGLALVAVVQCLHGWLGRRAGLAGALLAAAVALACGQLWWQGHALDFLALALVAPLALALLLPHEEEARRPLAWLLVAALALATYACGSQFLMVAYLPAGTEVLPMAQGAWGQLSAACALLAPVLALALTLLPPLRHKASLLRSIAALALLLSLAYAWLLLAAPVLQQHPKLLLTFPAPWVAMGLYAIALLLLAALGWLRCLAAGKSGDC